MRKYMWIIFSCLSMTLVVSAFGAEKKINYPHYWMSIATRSLSIPGMPTGMGGIAAVFGGKEKFGPLRELHLQLESPRVPPDAPKADHVVPAGQKMGNSLPLVPPEIEKSKDVPRGEMPEQYEKPKTRMLIYWGCGESIGTGQPKVIDTATMSLADFGKAFTGRAPTRQMPPSPRKGWTYSEWPNRDNRAEIPPDSSLVGNHLIKSNYTPDISFALDEKRDFMAPVEFSPLQKSASGAYEMEWKSIPTAIGYFASAIGHNQNDGESIFWSSSEVLEPGFALQDYLAPGDVARFIKEKIILAPSTTTCTIPPVFKGEGGGILQFIAYGEELNVSRPPKPKDPKKRWNIEWSAKVRLKSTAMMPLLAGEGRDSSNNEKKQGEPVEGPGKGDGNGEDSLPKEIGDRVRGLFGF